MADIVISGYYGFGNSGDDALLWAIIHNLKECDPAAKIVVLSKNPEKTEATYGVEAVNRYNPFAVLCQMRKARLLISGGGSLLQDGTSSKSLYYYLGIIKLAKKLGLKTMLYANGIGPLLHENNAAATAKTVSRVDLVTLRDGDSLDELKRAGTINDNMHVTADPAFTLEFCPQQADSVLAELGITEPFVAVSVRPWSQAAPMFEKQLAEAVAEFCAQNGVVPLLLPMQHSADLEICRRIASCCGGALCREPLDFHTMLAVTARAELVIGMRLHTLIYASAAGVPALALSYDPKIDGFMHYIKQPFLVDVEGFSKQAFSEQLGKLWEGRAEVKTALLAAKDTLSAKAKQNAAYAIGLLNGEGAHGQKNGR